MYTAAWTYTHVRNTFNIAQIHSPSNWKIPSRASSKKRGDAPSRLYLLRALLVTPSMTLGVRTLDSIDCQITMWIILTEWKLRVTRDTTRDKCENSPPFATPSWFIESPEKGRKWRTRDISIGQWRFFTFPTFSLAREEPVSVPPITSVYRVNLSSLSVRVATITSYTLLETIPSSRFIHY